MIVGSGTRERTYNRTYTRKDGTVVTRSWTRISAHVEYERSGDSLRGTRTFKEFRSQRAADAWIRSMVAADAERPADEATPAGPGTVLELLEWWEAHTADVKDWSPGHRRRVRQHIDKDLVSLHAIPAVELLPSHVEALQAQLAPRLSTASIRRVRAALSGALQAAVKDGRLRSNAVHLAAPPPYEEEPEPAYLDQEAARRFLVALEQERLRPYFLTQLALALRPSEAIGMEWDQVDFERSEVRITRAAVEDAGGITIRPTKTRRRRTIALPESLAETLRRHRAEQARLRERAPSWERPELVFTNSRGGYLHPHSVLDRVRVILRRIDRERAAALGIPVEALPDDERMPDVTSYELRHTGATLLLTLGVPIEEISRLMGHASLNTTMRYARATDPARRLTADRMGTFLANATGIAVGTSGGTKRKISQAAEVEQPAHS